MPTFLNDTIPSSVSPKSASSNMNDALVLPSTAIADNKDALVHSPPSGAQADVNDIQIVAPPRAVEERPLKCKSNYVDVNQRKQKKHPPISDTNLEAQVNQMTAENIVDLSLRATQA